MAYPFAWFGRLWDVATLRWHKNSGVYGNETITEKGQKIVWAYWIGQLPYSSQSPFAKSQIHLPNYLWSERKEIGYTICVKVLHLVKTSLSAEKSRLGMKRL
jgi:hypothetical protein